MPVLSPAYPTRVWAKIESDAFKERFGEGAVIPIKLSTVADGFFNAYMEYGFLAVDIDEDLEAQLVDIADTLSKRILNERAEAAASAAQAL